MTIRAIILDDHEAERRALRRRLAGERDFEVVAEAAAADAATALIQAGPVDVVFFDPAGVPDVAACFAALPAAFPPLVFVSADREYLAAAFELGAVDFIVKPYKRARWALALERVRTRLAKKSGREPATPAGASSAPLKRVTVRLADRLLVIDVADIDWIESANNYMVLHVGSDSHIVRETMNSLEARLPAERFVRISRSAIVNVTRIREIKFEPEGGHRLQLVGGASVPLTVGIRELQRRLECA